ncbi:MULTISPECIES: UDP-N-acetylmuramoyl-L-alanine--D-glutamate ligase [Pseudanabaena]|uniref:UDP-N-acetylmuramoyl-L-alanine--D-glutamate ligase n=1 Tax=Pseudanabaena TaxID=1152 RepID=UPI002479F894|nr:MULTISPECIES: UDP-N-acetylmuramoyl-L-alanine--D-glutamate ligase [Pseudanabaena]MEA5489861.1 UDP-N-acetylmuramoyl-L-alanine--D-glutamate ligase [Pseudanabaena sp. CCNP1317]WGS74151.1 UDP-N-acetylmuramoyl-L-alanine--D-glutamate ligase [Pseudanabaena galeata CCNP1313]
MHQVYVLGLGQSGISAAKLLKADGWQVTVSDSQASTSLEQRKQALESVGIAVELGGFPDFDKIVESGQSMDLVIVSPGVPWDCTAVEQARSLGIDTIGEIELAWRYLKHIPWVGITGTNGKTTVTSLTTAIFQAAGLKAIACGNIGFPACEIALQVLQKQLQPDWIIAELSSYQIESTQTVKPQIGIWTTFTPDHLNRHYTLEAYRDIKASLIHQSAHIVLNGNDPYLENFGAAMWPKAIWTGIDDHVVEAIADGACIEKGWVKFRGEPVFPISHWTLLGSHNRQNLLMSVAAAKLAGIEAEHIDTAISNFQGVPHRLEHVCFYEGIAFINDSKATNYDAAEVGLKAVKPPVVLIAGGQPKQGDASAWLEQIRQRAIGVLLIGEAASLFAEMLKDVGFKNYEIVETLENAVKQAAHIAHSRAHNHPSQPLPTVLFSPACASFDQFANFEQRGDRFRQLCQELRASP